VKCSFEKYFSNFHVKNKNKYWKIFSNSFFNSVNLEKDFILVNEKIIFYLMLRTLNTLSFNNVNFHHPPIVDYAAASHHNHHHFVTNIMVLIITPTVTAAAAIIIIIINATIQYPMAKHRLSWRRLRCYSGFWVCFLVACLNILFHFIFV